MPFMSDRLQCSDHIRSNIDTNFARYACGVGVAEGQSVSGEVTSDCLFELSDWTIVARTAACVLPPFGTKEA